ncbi:carbonic anhydrase [Trichoderma evansii]
MSDGQNSKQLFKLNDQATTYKRPTVQELLERNAQRAQTFKPILTFDDLISCDDPRIIASDILGLKQWGIYIYEIHYLMSSQEANSLSDTVVATGVAGRVAHQFENMLFLDHFLHFEDIMIIHHTNCSAGIFKNDEIHRALEERAPGHPSIRLPGFESLEQSVRDDIEFIKRSPLVRKELADRTTGYIYDIETGKLNIVA